MKLLNKAVRENFIVVYVSTGLTMNEYHSPIIVSLIEASAPDYWQLFTPSAYIAYYRSKKRENKTEAEKLLKGIEKIILKDNNFEDFKVGINEGMAITELDWEKARYCCTNGYYCFSSSQKSKRKRRHCTTNLSSRPVISVFFIILSLSARAVERPRYVSQNRNIL